MTDTTQNSGATTQTTDTTSATATDSAAPAKQLFPTGGDTVAGGQDTTAGGDTQDTTSGGQQNDSTEGGDKKAEPPVEYTDFTLPENFTAIPEQMQWVKDYAKEHGLTQQAAQAVVDKYVEIQQSQLSDWQALKDSWAEEVKADKDYGGQNLVQSQNTANEWVQRFGDDALIDDLVELGVGNKLSVMRSLNKSMAYTRELEAKIASLTGEDNIGKDGKGGDTAPQSAAQLIWGAEHKK